MNNLLTFLIYGVLAAGVLTARAGAAFADINNIVLVHSANVDGSIWRPVYDRLTAEG